VDGCCWSSAGWSDDGDVLETDCACRACSPDESVLWANAGLGQQTRAVQISKECAKNGTAFLIRAIDMIFEAPFKLKCVLNRSFLAAYFSKFEIQGELDLPGTGSGDGLLKPRYRSQT
jgi:hypothetical protein